MVEEAESRRACFQLLDAFFQTILDNVSTADDIGKRDFYTTI